MNQSLDNIKLIENLKKNTSIEINVIDPFSRMGYRFKGVAKIISSGDDFQNILDYFEKKRNQK